MRMPQIGRRRSLGRAGSGAFLLWLQMIPGARISGVFSSVPGKSCAGHVVRGHPASRVLLASASRPWCRPLFGEQRGAMPRDSRRLQRIAGPCETPPLCRNPESGQRSQPGLAFAERAGHAVGHGLGKILSEGAGIGLNHDLGRHSGCRREIPDAPELLG